MRKGAKVCGQELKVWLCLICGRNSVCFPFLSSAHVNLGFECELHFVFFNFSFYIYMHLYVYNQWGILILGSVSPGLGSEGKELLCYAVLEDVKAVASNIMGKTQTSYHCDNKFKG